MPGRAGAQVSDSNSVPQAPGARPADPLGQGLCHDSSSSQSQPVRGRPCLSNWPLRRGQLVRHSLARHRVSVTDPIRVSPGPAGAASRRRFAAPLAAADSEARLRRRSYVDLEPGMSLELAGRPSSPGHSESVLPIRPGTGSVSWIQSDWQPTFQLGQLVTGSNSCVLSYIIICKINILSYM